MISIHRVGVSKRFFRTREDWSAFALPILVSTNGLLQLLLYHDYALLQSDAMLAMAGAAITGSVVGMVLVAVRSETIRSALIGLLLLAYWDTRFRGLQSLARAEMDGPNLLKFAVLFGSLALGFAVLFLLRRHLATVLTVVFGVLTLATIALPNNGIWYGTKLAGGTSVADPSLPLVVHLVLDAHLGIEGVPQDIEGGPELRQDLIDFYLRYGFRLYGMAYSRHFVTRHSVGSLLNPSGPEFGHWSPPATEQQAWSLTHNEAFSHFSERGYAISAYQTDYMDFCQTPRQNLEQCHRYPATNLRLLDKLETSPIKKARLLILVYLERSLIFLTATKLYDRAESFLRRQGWNVLPTRNQHTLSLSSLGVLDAIGVLASDLREDHRGRFVFAHLMLPHAPFLLSSSCQVIPDTGSWLDRKFYRKSYTAKSTPDFRAAAYRAYFDQTRCLMSALSEVFDALQDVWDTTTIVLHGDHGSRITILDPTLSHLDDLSDRDLIDGYSTLYAIKAPWLEPGYDLRMVSVQDLYAEHILNRSVRDERLIYSAPGRRHHTRQLVMPDPTISSARSSTSQPPD